MMYSIVLQKPIQMVAAMSLDTELIDEVFASLPSSLQMITLDACTLSPTDFKNKHNVGEAPLLLRQTLYPICDVYHQINSTGKRKPGDHYERNCTIFKKSIQDECAKVYDYLDGNPNIFQTTLETAYQKSYQNGSI